MKRTLLGAVVLSALVSGCASSGARLPSQAQPPRSVLVYAKAVPPYLPNTSENVWRANVTGGDRKILAKNAAEPAVSPDGRYVAYTSRGKVLVVPTIGGRAREVYALEGKGAG